MVKHTGTSKINSTGWAHLVEIEEGVSEIYNWYKR
tara:strand:- start:273 stop:377 length:105 start_codon:yes stop_codon:yes gene_type:complete